MSRNSLGCSCTLVDSHCASVTFLLVVADVVDVVVVCVGGGISVVVARRIPAVLRTMSSLLLWRNNN
jgi:hypothetical protein